MASLTDAEEGLRSTDGKEHFQRLTRLLMCGGVRLLREKFDSFHSSADLPLKLVDPAIIAQLKGAKLSKPEWDSLYPSAGAFGKSTDFDITLTFKLLRTICSLTKPTTGWDNLPNIEDNSLAADLARIKYYRNSVYGHNQKMEITHSEFCNLWKEISEALLRIAASLSSAKRDEWKEAIGKLLRDPLTTEAQRYVDELQLWYKNDMDVKHAVEQVREQLQQVNEDLRDQLQHINAHVADVGYQLQQINQRLGYITTVIQIAVENFSEVEQPVGSSYFPMLPRSRVAVGSVNQEQLQSGGAEGGHIEGNRRSAPTEPYIWKDILSVNEYFNQFLEYLKVQLGLGVVSYRVGSLSITVTCSSLQILERLWKDYISGHLNKVAEQKLVSPDVLEKLGLKELKLKTTITEQEYKKCKEFFLGTGQYSRVLGTGMESIRRKIDEAEDIADVIELMQSLNIQTRGCKSIEQMKTTIFDHLRSRKDSNLASNEAFRVISDAQSLDKQKSLHLLNFYSEVEREVRGLDDSFLNLLNTSEGDVLTKMRSKMERMENRDYVVLVAGETSAGKSRMLNLILGEELLPFSVLSTTSTICELKYGRDRRIKIHYGEQGKPPKTKYLDGSSSYIDQISEFVHVKSASLREKASDYKKVELFWPHILLKDGVVIVDSPGVGESDIMDEIVVNYLPNAFAFIYVINSANAGGVQKDRLVRLLHKTRQLTTEQQMEFSPSCTLFVCNKWDNIPPDEASDVITLITNKLRLCLPDLDPETQIIRLSTTKALMAQKFGIMNAEFASLTENISCLVTKSIKTRLEQNWSWLDQLLKRIIWIMKSFIDNINTDHVAATQRLNKVIERLRKLQAEQELSKQELKRRLDQEIRDAIEVLASYLKSPEVIESFCRWNTDELPDIEGSWEVTESAINKLVQNRLQTVIEEWEEEHGHFANARKSVVSFFLMKYNYLEKELHNLEVNVSQTQRTTGKINESVEERVFNKINDFSLTIGGNIVLGIMAPFIAQAALVGALLAVPATLLVLPVVGIKSIADRVQEGMNKSAYNKDRSAFVRYVSLKYLEKVSTFEALQPLVEDQLTQAFTCLDELQAKIPMLVEADVQLCQHLIDESRSKKETESLYKPRKEKCERLRGELGLFGSLEIRSMHIAWNDLEWDISDEVYQKHSFPPGIYQGRITKGRYASSQQVTLKVYRNLLNSSNVTECLADEATMRKLRHPHIVAFYGAAFRKVPRGVEVALVMERCGETLKYYLIDQPGNCPSVNPRSTLGVVQWTEQIVDALMMIHSMFEGCVHGDLRLENVLLDSCNLQNVKLSNICLTRQLTIEPGSKCDEFLHLPPEAIRNRAYNASSEIYCLGIILWEMWYGKEAFLEMKDQDLEVFLVNVEEGHRPELTGLDTQTSMRWCELLSGCWEKNATERKTLTDCKSTITAILANQK